MVVSYCNSLEHILDELRILNILLANTITKIKKNNDPLNNDFSGLIISEHEVDKMLEYLSDNKSLESSSFNDVEYDRVADNIQKKLTKTIRSRIHLSLQQIIENFSLSIFEKQILLFCLAPEIDKAYSTLYAYLHDNISKKKPSSSLILDLTCNNMQEKMLYRRYFSADSTLFRYGIIQNSSDDEKTSFDSLVINPYVLNFLLGNKKSPNYNSEWNLFEFDNLDASEYLPKITQKIFHYVSNNQKSPKPQNDLILLCGPKGVGKKTLAASLCRQFSSPLLIVNSGLLSQSKFFEINFRQILLESKLNQSVIYLDDFDLLFDDVSKAAKMLELLSDTNPLGIVFASSTQTTVPSFLKDIGALPLSVSLPDYLERKKIWKNKLDDVLSDDVLDDISNKFKFTRKQILDAITYAKNLSSLENANKNSFSVDSLYRSCKLQSSDNLSNLALKVTSPYSWNDLVLPDEKKHQLLDVVNYIKNKNQVYSEWGFGEKLSPNWGLNVLFAGESGTGKTLAAQVIANELNLDLYKIDLSSIISKYIGETEKNLNKIFSDAKNSNSLLFFDEADALFGKRSEVKDAHDRYANIEVGYLLQKLESHQEVVILATNLPKNIDDAFLRRMQFWVEFPFPDYEQRLHIWKNAFPPTAPVDLTEKDFQFLAEKFHISGGNIKNIVLTSAFLASNNKNLISMFDVMHAIKREYEKIGNPCTKSEFGMYYDFLKSVN